MDIAKRLIDFNFHAPTVYFPLIVPEALMIEPTETESRETLEAFARVLRRSPPRTRSSCTPPHIPHPSAGRTRSRPRGRRCCDGSRAEALVTRMSAEIDDVPTLAERHDR